MNAVAKVLVGGALAALWSCGGGGSRSAQQGRLKLRAGASLSGAQACGVDLPACPEGLSCLGVRLEGEDGRALCLDVSTVCNALTCVSGSCAVLESSPAQVVCEGTGGSGADGDAPSSNRP